MKSWLQITAVLILAAMAVGQTCLEQVWPPMDGYSIVLDPNQIAKTEDANGVMRPLPLRVVTVALGQTAVVKIYSCDPDGDPINVTCEKGTLTPVENEHGYWLWRYTPTQVGPEYCDVTTRDVRPETNDSKAKTGTIVVVTIPRNRPPVLCGGQP